MTNNIIYLHGFRSDSGSSKITKLRKALPDYGIWTTNFSPNPTKVLEQIEDLIKQSGGKNQEGLYFMGTSLGGFYALYSALVYKRPCFLINPSLAPHISLQTQVGDYRSFNLALPYHFKESYIPKLSELHDIIWKGLNAESSPKGHLHTFFNDDDDIIHHSGFEKYKKYLSYQILTSGGHRASNMQEILDLIKPVLSH